MAVLTVQSISRAGTALASVSAAGGGDTFTVDNSKTFLYVNNGSGSAITVTIVTPATLSGYSDIGIADIAVSVPATSERFIGPFPKEFFADSSTGLATVTYSGVTSLAVGAFKLAQP